MEPWQIWVIASLIFFIIEIFTVGFVVVCFAVGGLFGAVAAACGLGIVWQIAIFAVATAVTFFFIRPIIMKLFYNRDKEIKTNADAIIGRIGVVSEAINPATGTGRVKIDGDDWKAVVANASSSASNSDALAVIPEGTHVKIVERDGLTLKVMQ